MKSGTAVCVACCALLILGADRRSPAPVTVFQGKAAPVVTESIDAVTETVDVAGKPSPTVNDERPEVWVYEPSSCPVCVQFHGEVERFGADALPFRLRYGDLEQLDLASRQRGGPWFYWPCASEASGWIRLHGLDRVNGRRLDYLLREWHATQPPAERDVPDSGQDGVKVCCCGGVDTAACLCADELRAGVDRKHCTCTPEYGSRHKPDASGPAGGYRPLEGNRHGRRNQTRRSGGRLPAATPGLRH